MARITKLQLDVVLFAQNRVILELLPDQPSDELDQFIFNMLYRFATANMGSGHDAIQASLKLEDMRDIMSYRQMREIASLSPDYADHERHHIAEKSKRNIDIHLSKPIPETGRRLTLTEVIQVAKQGVRASVSNAWALIKNNVGEAEIRWRDGRTNEGAMWVVNVNVAPAEVPNLDAMELDELMAFWKRHQHGHNQRFLLPNGIKGCRRIVADLANYAANKATAMRNRLDGNIETALQYESICESIYEGLPATARW